MTTRTTLVKVVLFGGLLALPWSARAGVPIEGGNTDFPDSTLVMPYSAVAPRSTFLAMSNVGQGEITARWVFYDESGQRLDEVSRAIYGEGGTDIVDVTAIRDRSINGEGQFVEGPSRSLAGREGFVVVVGNGEPRLIGNLTIANLTTNSAFGANATGLGVLGTLRQGGFLLGTTFNPATLQDNLLIVLALNVVVVGDQVDVTSLTNGAPPSGQPLFNAEVFLQGNDPNNATIASTIVPVTGSSLFTSLQDLFPGVSLNSSASIFVTATEGSGYTGSKLDPDGDNGIGIIGYYGQALGPFGTGQSLRAGTFFE